MDLQLPVISVLLAVCVLPVGVMAAGLDGDLVGVVAAAVVIGVLLIIIIGFMAYCCFRRMETERTPVILRKDSSTMLTVTPRWSANTHPTIPVFNVATEPYLYNTHPYYYLGDYRPKYIGAEPLQYVHPYRLELEDRRRVEQREEEEHVQPTTLQVEHTSQPNGHVVHDFSSSSANYRVIRKHHQHTRMPDWLTKSYGESKMSMDLEDEGSRVGSMRLALTSGQEEQDDPERAARAQVSPRDSTLDARDLLHYSDDFTIIDYVDPDRGRPRSAGNRQATTTTITTTTTMVSQRTAINTSNASSEYVPPASTSTPRYPPTTTTTPGGDTGLLTPVDEGHDLDSHRQRKPGEGSIAFLPDAARDVRL